MCLCCSPCRLLIIALIGVGLLVFGGSVLYGIVKSHVEETVDSLTFNSAIYKTLSPYAAQLTGSNLKREVYDDSAESVFNQYNRKGYEEIKKNWHDKIWHWANPSHLLLDAAERAATFAAYAQTELEGSATLIAEREEEEEEEE